MDTSLKQTNGFCTCKRLEICMRRRRCWFSSMWCIFLFWLRILRIVRSHHHAWCSCSSKYVYRLSIYRFGTTTIYKTAQIQNMSSLIKQGARMLREPHHDSFVRVATRLTALSKQALTTSQLWQRKISLSPNQKKSSPSLSNGHSETAKRQELPGKRFMSDLKISYESSQNPKSHHHHYHHHKTAAYWWKTTTWILQTITLRRWGPIKSLKKECWLQCRRPPQNPLQPTNKKTTIIMKKLTRLYILGASKWSRGKSSLHLLLDFIPPFLCV